MYKAFHHAHSMYSFGSSEHISVHVISIYMALNNFLKGIIYICLGFIAKDFIGGFANIAFIIATYYMFFALKAVHLEDGPDLSKEEHTKKFNELVVNVLDKDGKNV